MRCSAYNSVHAGIAQLVEQLICNQKVPGSIPGAGTNKFIISNICTAGSGATVKCSDSFPF